MKIHSHSHIPPPTGAIESTWRHEPAVAIHQAGTVTNDLHRHQFGRSAQLSADPTTST